MDDRIIERLSSVQEAFGSHPPNERGLDHDARVDLCRSDRGEPGLRPALAAGPRRDLQGSPGPGRPIARGAGQAGALVRGPRPDRRAAPSPHPGHPRRPEERRRAGLDGSGQPRRPLAPPRGRRRPDQGRPRPGGDPGRIRGEAAEGRLHRRRPVGPGDLGRRARPARAGQGAPDGRDPARPVARGGLEEAGLQEARRAMGHRRPARRSRRPRPRPRRRPTGSGSRSWKSYKGMLDQPSKREEAEAALVAGDRPARRADDHAGLRHRPVGRATPRRATARPDRFALGLPGAGRPGGLRRSRPRSGASPSRPSRGATPATSSGSGSP